VTRRSLRFRLLIAAVVSITAALVIAGLGLVALFQNHVERRIGAELETYLGQVIANITISADGRIRLTQELADPRFRQPLSGLYWQIQDDDRPTLLRSRSLWDGVIELPEDELAPGRVHQHTLPGPGNRPLLARERRIIFQPDSVARRLRIAVAVDRGDLVAARNAFAADMLPYLAVIACLLSLAAWVQIRIGLAPLGEIRRGVVAIRSGATRRLSNAYPDEVMPLVEEMNGLLEAQEQAIERARAWTADLAHGLKTPLMVLTADSQRLREQGNTAIADDLDQLAETMRRRVERELIRARARSGVQTRQARADLGAAVHGIIRTLKRTPRGERLDWHVEGPERIFAAILPDDLGELLGNLLENASKWAQRTVSVSVSERDAVAVLIEDDGPGVSDPQLKKLGLRGLRLDEQMQGSGLGLAIARDITEAYHGDLSFDRAGLGGLAVTVRLPRSA
jgi:signal transduction histidine kinase